MSCPYIQNNNLLFKFCIKDCEIARKSFMINIIQNNIDYLHPSKEVVSNMNTEYIKRYKKCLKNCLEVEHSDNKQKYSN